MKLRIILLLVVVVIASACDKKKKDTEWVSHGDPAEIVKGTDVNRGITDFPRNFNLSSLYLVDLHSFVSKSIRQSYQELLKEQDTSNLFYQEADVFHTPVKHEATSSDYRSVTVASEDGNEYTFKFLVDGNFIALIYVLKNSVDLKINMNYSHLSIDGKNNRMSILFYYTEGDFIKLTRAYLTPRFFTKPPQLDPSLFYLAGKGIGVRWQKNTEFVTCGLMPREIQTGTKQAVDKWSPHIRSISVQYSHSNRCPPFSDLHHQGIYYIQNFRTTGNSMFFVPAFVSPLGTDSIHDADMFTLADEMKVMYAGEDHTGNFESYLMYLKVETDIKSTSTGEYFYGYVVRSLNTTLTHEIGHMIGLGHNFDGTTSIMSYENKTYDGSLSTYDIRAVRELYK